MKIQSFDFSINVLRSLLWRHNEAVNLQTLMQNKQDALDELNKDFWEAWITDVFDLRTANEFGLSVWAIILDIPLTIEIGTPEPDNSAFGFGEFRKNFNNGNFVSMGDSITLSLEDARKVLKLRYYQLVVRPTVTQTNKVLDDIFGDEGAVYILDGLDMSSNLAVFDFSPSTSLQTALESFDLIPRPSGVKMNTITEPNSKFGFGSFRKNFDNGNFRR